MYHSYFKKINAFYETKVKKRNMLKYRDFLEGSQWWDAAKLKEFQWSELQKLLQHACDRVPYWQELFGNLKINPKDIKSHEDLRRLPIIDKDCIRSNYELFIAANYRGKTWSKSTGGSTGQPFHFEYTPDSYDWRVACSKRGYGWAGCEDGKKQAHIWGAAIGNISILKQIKEYVHRSFLRRKYYNCFNFNTKSMEHVFTDLNANMPEYIIGYTNPLYEFAKFTEQKGGLSFRPQGVISAAEKLYEFQRTKIEKSFGCCVFNTYGSREFMLIASECEVHKGMHLNIENFFIEIIKEDGTVAKTGEMGDIVITDLHNYGMPFIRYKIGDMAIASNRNCACGRGLPLIEDVVGRSLDVIRTPDDRVVPGEFFPHLMKDFEEIDKFQVHQEDIASLRINIVKRKEIPFAKLNFIKNEIFKVMGKEMHIDINYVEDIPLTQSGKFRVVSSKIQANSGR